MRVNTEQLLSIRAVKDCFKSESGTALYRFLEKFCYAKARTFVIQDPYLSAYNEGMRAVFLELQKMKEWPEEKLTATIENLNAFEDIYE